MPIMNPRAIFFPYCIQKIKDDRHVVLNRNYKPLGFITEDFVTYENYPIGVKFKGLTARKAALISYKGSTDLDTIYLYNDGCIPTESAANMKAYLARLEVLAKLKFAEEN
jgi:hypothetical protein